MPNHKVNIIKETKLILNNKKVKSIIPPRKINKFTKSGAYISVSGDHSGYYAYVVVLKKGIKK